MEDRTLPRAHDDILAWIGLGLCAGIEPRRARGLVAQPGALSAGLAAAAGRELAAIDAAGARAVVLPDAAYPPALRTIADPPLVLVVRGEVLAADELAVAVVGARRASEYGRRLAEEIAHGLALAGVTVVSGLAAGIDAAAHRGALAAGGRTIAVLGTGIDVVYPAWHRGLAAEVARHGALVTELPCGAPPMQHHFPRRNRLISGLSLGVVVVEAAEESGSLVTARWALEQNRDVFAVPGPAGAPGHRGPHRLIREGATLVERAEDVLAAVAPQVGARLAAARARVATDGLGTAERRVLEVIGPAARHVDEVIRHLAVPPATALETLLALELRGLVDHLPGQRYRRKAA